MAKQTFTTGQVLLASQLTSLQQTAMLGGSASNKTSSYTLVAADAGTAISMTSTSATTITVNTGLFAAGDTVQITNLGSGVSTITAGTATVNTSASLALAQYESGTLDFTSTSAAIFIKGAGGAGGGMTLISSTALSGNSVTVSSIPSTYVKLFGVVTDAVASGVTGVLMRLNADTGSNYTWNKRYNSSASVFSNSGALNQDSFDALIAYISTSTTQQLKGFSTFEINNYVGTSGVFVNSQGIGSNGTDPSSIIMIGQYNNAADITSVTVKCEGAVTFSSGNFYLYGVK